MAKVSPLYPLLQRGIVIALIIALGAGEIPAQAAEVLAAPQEATQAAAPPAPPDMSPANLDHLMAPIALYPDALLMQVLAGAVNSQEILDAGNWLLENKGLQGTQIDDAAKKLGFSAATTALLHFPEVVDQMCTNIDWTAQVGGAFAADQKAVLASIQRLRAQAVQYGNLKTTPQQTVQTQTDNGQQVVVIQPANPQIVYVPQYNPQTVYVQSSGPSTGDVVAASVISFGVGMAVGAIFANNNNYCYPRWGYGGVYYGGRPFYPPPYRPIYGPAFRPAYGYRPPANYPYHRVNHYNSNYYNNYRPGGNNYRGGGNSYRGGNNTVNINTGNKNNIGNGNNNNRPGNGNGYNKPGNGNNAGNNRPGGNNPGGGYNKPGTGNNAGNNRPGAGGGNNAGNNRPGNGAGNGRPTNANVNRPAPDRGYTKPAGAPKRVQLRGTRPVLAQAEIKPDQAGVERRRDRRRKLDRLRRPNRPGRSQAEASRAVPLTRRALVARAAQQGGRDEKTKLAAERLFRDDPGSWICDADTFVEHGPGGARTKDVSNSIGGRGGSGGGVQGGRRCRASADSGAGGQRLDFVGRRGCRQGIATAFRQELRDQTPAHRGSAGI